MKRSELLSRILIIAGIFLAVGAPLFFWSSTPLIHARMSENGGWNPDVIQGDVNEPLHLRFTSDDVVHGFAVGQMEMEGVDILPGKVTDLTLTFDKPGIYTFFCTRWCGLNHWRMRGTIEVSGSPSDPEPAEPALSEAERVPLYVSLDLNLDTPHDAPVIPNTQPSAIKGRQLAANLSIDRSVETYRMRSPYQVFDELNNTSLTEAQRWDMVAYIWQSNTSKESLANGQKLYAQNCAACHGENGAGNGVFADDLQSAGDSSMQSMNGSMEMSMQTPVDFTDPTRMLGASPALLQGKILRGGMGTGMPMWGSIFTEEQIWDLIAYLYSFQFEYHN
jgi:mono/diheme cytochrome c family protein